jgi:hypothetical protein
MFAALLLAATLAGARMAAADDPTPIPTLPPADCSIVDAKEASKIIGFEVQPPDEISRSGGICHFSNVDITHEGMLSYALITPDRLPQRRAYFYAVSRRCAPAVKGTLNYLGCRQYLKLADAQTLDDYFAARTSSGDASPIPGLGESAVVNGNALYVKRAQTVFEVSVTVAGEFDLERSTRLASELLARTPQ